MNPTKLLAFLAPFILLVSLTANANSPVWKISKGDSHLFIGGTIHVLSQTDYPLPAQFEQAYRQAQSLVFEADMLEMQSPAAQQLLMSSTVYRDGTTLKDVLSAATYLDLAAYFTERRLPTQQFLTLKPGMMSVTLTMLELQILGIAGTGVDEFYTLKAIKDGKQRHQLESVEQQIRFIDVIGQGNPDRLISYTLRDIEQLRPMMSDMKNAWRSGDTDRMTTITVTPMAEEFPSLYQSLLVNRNRAWLPKIEALFANNEVELILVGSAHLVGSDSVLALLEARGYRVEML